MSKGITIRLGAAHNSVAFGDTKVDLSTTKKSGRYEVRKGLIEGLKIDGFFGKKEQRRAIYRHNRDKKAEVQSHDPA